MRPSAAAGRGRVMDGDAAGQSRREWLVCLGVVVLRFPPPATTVPRLEPDHLEDLERRLWEALLADVRSMWAACPAQDSPPAAPPVRCS
jgi:hypothetical protein